MPAQDPLDNEKITYQALNMKMLTKLNHFCSLGANMD